MLFGGRAARSGLFDALVQKPERMDRSRDADGARIGRPTCLSTAERKAAMSAEILKRKLRNFPVASLNERIATS